MKKIYASIVVLLMASSVFAQRTVRLSVSLVSPASGTTLEAGVTSFDQKAVITVLGPDVLKPGDSILFQDIANTSPSQFWVYKGYTKGVNDTIQLNKLGLMLSGGTSNPAANYCVSAFIQSRGTPSDTVLIDSIYGTCNSINYINNNPGGGGGGLSVFTYENVDAAVNTLSNTFPNPARSEANFVINMARNEAVTVKVMDLAGRVVLSENKGNLNQGKQTITVNTSSIASGLYMYQITMGANVATGKLNIAK